MSNFHLRIVSIDGMFYDGEAKQIALQTIDGQVSILANHIPYVTAIGAGECRVYIEDKDTQTIKRASCIGGFINVSKELVLVAATTFEWAEDIDYDRAVKAKAYAENIIETDSNEKKLRIAKNKLRRANVRIKVVNNNKE